MAEEKKKKVEEKREETKQEENLIRILGTDIPSEKSVYAGLTRIKGIAWSFSNAICNVLNINKRKKLKELGEEDIKKIIEFVKNPNLPKFILNRRKDFETGQDMHLVGAESELQKDFDIKRLRKIRSYRGFRHALGQPTRGQRTRSHFRKHKAVGVMKKGKIRKSGK
ncbi:MAG: 30S ribosomal protein S13 [Nanoarchaeota archaeon]